MLRAVVLVAAVLVPLVRGDALAFDVRREQGERGVGL